jgi:hypothetical protein
MLSSIIAIAASGESEHVSEEFIQKTIAVVYDAAA